MSLHFAGPVPGTAGGTPVNNLTQLLFQLVGANHAITTDQTFTKIFTTGTLWIPQIISDTWVSGAFNTACAGGIYTGAAKTGTAIVAAGQSYAALTGSGTAVNAAIAATGPFSVTPIFSLTTGNTGALTGTLNIFGVVIG